MYKMTIDVSGKQRAVLFRRRTEMLEWWDDFLSLADGDEDIASGEPSAIKPTSSTNGSAIRRGNDPASLVVAA